MRVVCALHLICAQIPFMSGGNMRFWRRAKHQEWATPAPGWYQSPADPAGRLRWWSGARWTTSVHESQSVSPIVRDTHSTSTPMSRSAVAEQPAVDNSRRVPLPGNGRQSVAGESYRQQALRAVTRGMHLPRVTGDNWDDSVSMTAELHPEPDNSFDRNAVRVEIDHEHVGYLPADDAPDYQPLLLRLATKGIVGTCESRLMIASHGDICVYLHLSPPDEVAFAVNAPENAIPLSAERTTTVTGEEHHQEILRKLAATISVAPWSETAALGFCTIARGKYAGQQAIEVRVGGERVGQLTRAMTERYERPVREALDASKTPICRATLWMSPDKGVQVELMMPAVGRSMWRGAHSA